MNQHDVNQGDFSTRLTRVESTIENLASTVTTFVNASRQRDENLYGRMEKVQSEFANSRQANYPMLIGFGTIALMFAGMMVTLIMFSQKSIVMPLQVKDIAIEQRINLIEKFVLNPDTMTWIRPSCGLSHLASQ